MTPIPTWADSTVDCPRSTVHSACFVQLHSGRCVDLLAPDLAEVTLTDLATGLARIPRFLGATRGDHAYSVAQHSVLVAQLLQHAPLPLRRAALLHDAHEAILGDIATPVKRALGRQLVAELERRIALPLYARFRLAPALLDDARVKHADRTALAMERRDLMARSAWDWPEDLPEPLRWPPLRPWPASLAQAQFLAHANALGLF